MPVSGITSQQQRFVEMPAALQTGLTVWHMAEDFQRGFAWPNRGSAPAATLVGSVLVAPNKTEVSLNQRQVVRFRVSEGRYRGTGLCTDGSFPLTVMYVGRMWGANTGRIFSMVVTPYNVLFGTHSAGNPVLYDNGWAGSQTPWGAFPSPWKIYAAVCAAGPSSQLWDNGTLMATTYTSIGHDNRYCLSGQDAAATTETCDCDVAEVLCWNRTLTVQERTDAESYLRAKWVRPYSISALTDTFDTSIDSTVKWPFIRLPVWDAGRVRLDCQSSQYYCIQSDRNYTLVGSSIMAKVTAPAAADGRTTVMQYSLPRTGNQNNWFEIEIDSGPSVTQIYADRSANGVYSSSALITYNPTQHAWLRIRESGGTVYFETSPDSIGWSTLWSFPTSDYAHLPEVLSPGCVYFGCGLRYGGNSGSAAYIDNVNVPP